MKKTLSLVLTVLMALSIITVAGTSVSAAEAASVNGEACSVGNTVKVTYSLQTPGAFEDFQGNMEYSDGLKYVSSQLTETKGLVMKNDKIDGVVYYSGSTADTEDPYNYSSLSAFYVATFEVVKAGAQTVKNSMEYITGTNGTQYYDAGVNNGCTENLAVEVIPVPVTDVILDMTTASVYTGSKTTLTATVGPELASDKTVTWTSSNEAVAKVDNGVVTAVKAGTATITAKAGDVTAECVFTVKDKVVKVTKVAMSKTAVSIYNGKTYTLKATVTPSNATNKAVTWSTSNKAVATVTAKGVVKGIKPGTATIKATAKDGSKKYGSCKVTVKQQKATKLTINKKSASLANKGKSTTIKATLAPTNVYNKNIKVSSSNKKVVKVAKATIKSGQTVKITAVKKGSANIKFLAADGSKKSATCKVTVKK